MSRGQLDLAVVPVGYLARADAKCLHGMSGLLHIFFCALTSIRELNDGLLHVDGGLDGLVAAAELGDSDAGWPALVHHDVHPLVLDLQCVLDVYLFANEMKIKTHQKRQVEDVLDGL